MTALEGDGLWSRYFCFHKCRVYSTAQLLSRPSETDQLSRPPISGSGRCRKARQTDRLAAHHTCGSQRRFWLAERLDGCFKRT